MKWGLLVLTVIIVLPFSVYVLSKIQMLGWVHTLKEYCEEEENKRRRK